MKRPFTFNLPVKLSDVPNILEQHRFRLRRKVIFHDMMTSQKNQRDERIGSFYSSRQPRVCKQKWTRLWVINILDSVDGQPLSRITIPKSPDDMSTS